MVLRFAAGVALVSHSVFSSPSADCKAFNAEVADGSFPSVDLPYPGLAFEGNYYGAGGRNTTLQHCVADYGPRGFGWNWTRGHTEKQCVTSCKAKDCFADFTIASLGYGISPWGKGTNASGMPVNLDNLENFTISQNLTWQWTDDAPGVDPPQTGADNERRVRLIYDMFLTSLPPNGSNIQTAITDEIIITLAANPGFPGSQPPGCLHPGDKFSNKTWGPVKEKAVWDGYHWYDYFWTDHDDAVPNLHTRYSSFRRKGGDVLGAQAPLHVDVKPFIKAIRDMWPGEQVGPWLGHVSIGTELYDHCSGSLTFHEAPKFKPHPALSSASTLPVVI